MMPREQIYRFDDLDNRAAITVQHAIEARKMLITKEESTSPQKGDKALKAVIFELDQMFDDLDRHIAARIRKEELERKVSDIEARDNALRSGSD